MRKKYIVAVAIIISFLFLATIVVLYEKRRDNSSSQVAQPLSSKPQEKYSRLEIKLKDGKLAHAPNTYLVKPGTNLEFNITSNKFGKVGVGIDPPQTITFTQSPLTFHLTAPRTAGSYVLSYQADDSNTVIQIGTIAVSENK